MRIRTGTHVSHSVLGRRKAQRMEKILADTRKDINSQSLSLLARELANASEADDSDPLPRLLGMLHRSLMPPTPLNINDKFSVEMCRRGAHALQRLGLILLSLDEAPKSASISKYKSSAYRRILLDWVDIAHWMFYLILHGPKVDPQERGPVIDTTHVLRIIAEHADEDEYKAEIVAQNPTIDLLFLLLRQKNEATGEFWELESGPKEHLHVTANLLVLYCQSEMGLESVISRLALSSRNTRDAVARSLVYRVRQSARNADADNIWFAARTATLIIDAAAKIARDPGAFRLLAHCDFLKIYAGALLQLSEKALRWGVPADDNGFWHRVSCGIELVVIMAIGYGPDSPRSVRKVIEAGLLTCSLHCLRHASGNTDPGPLVEALRLFLPYVYTQKAFSEIDRTSELEDYWGTKTLVSEELTRVWSAYRAAATLDHEVFQSRKERYVPMCSNLKCSRSARESDFRICSRCHATAYCCLPCQEEDWKSFHHQECGSLSAEYNVATSDGTWCSFAKRRDCAKFLDWLVNRDLPPPAEEMSLWKVKGDHLPSSHETIQRGLIFWSWDARHNNTLEIRKQPVAWSISGFLDPGPWKQRMDRMALDMQRDPNTVLARVGFFFDHYHVSTTFAIFRYSSAAEEGERYSLVNSVFRLHKIEIQPEG